jgi:uncharacterized protein YbjT (DUF2867 family)
MRALVTGATGFVGARLAQRLAGQGVQVRCMVRDAARAEGLDGTEVVEGDALDPATLHGLGDGVDVAYYLIHSMGRGGSGDFASADRDAARNVAQALADVPRMVYLGGLGEPHSRHLKSRHETAEVLREHGPPLTYFRAAMVVGSQSESYRTLRHLVSRLPVMIAPAWLRNDTQPIDVSDVISYLAAAPSVPAGEIQIGGPDVLSYREMLLVMADALGKRRPPMVPVPLLSPTLSSLWIGLVTPVDTAIAKPLVEGLSTPTIVTEPSGMQQFDIAPIGFREMLERALAEELRTVEA